MTKGRAAIVAVVALAVGAVGATGCRDGATPSTPPVPVSSPPASSTAVAADANVPESAAPPLATGAPDAADASVNPPTVVQPARAKPPHGRFKCGKTSCDAPDEVCCSDDDETLTCVKRDASSTTGEPWALDKICDAHGVGANAHFAAECGDTGNCPDGAYCCDPGGSYVGAYCTHELGRCFAEVCASPSTCRIRNHPKPVRCGGGTCPIGTPCCRRDGKESCSKTCDEGLALSCRASADCTGPLGCCTASFPDSSGVSRTSTTCMLSCSGATSGVNLCSTERECSSDGSSGCVGTCGAAKDGPVCRTDADCAGTTDAGPASHRCLPSAWLGSRYCYYFGLDGGT